MVRQVTGALAVAVGVMLAAGCGGSGSGGPAGAPGCPADAPSPAPPGRPAGPGGLLRPGPVVAAICQYGSGAHPLALRVVLRARAAAGLAAVIDSGGPVTRGTRRCDQPGRQLPYRQVLAFGYPSGQVSRVAVTQLTCDRGVVTALGHSAVLGFGIASDLFALSGAGRHPRGPRTPSLIGMDAVTAAAVARHHRFSVYVDGGVDDVAAPFGSVVFQSPPAGLPDSEPGRQVDVVVAVRTSPACVAGQLELSYLGGGAGAGNDFGTLLIGDRSSRPCTLTGPLHVSGLDLAGRKVTATVGYPVTGVAVLSPGIGTVARSSPGGTGTGMHPGDLTGVSTLRAEYRDGPAGVDRGLCAPLWVVPASWRVTLAGGTSLVVANINRHDRGLVPSGGLVTCRGRLDGAGSATVTGSLSG
ncbi:MAG TPA: PASTA domain-containing protein [Streptosporangiaceae bacterium]|nr:PASTA domain-containing protein [Streptosporangiaceae bacterium]